MCETKLPFLRAIGIPVVSKMIYLFLDKLIMLLKIQNSYNIACQTCNKRLQVKIQLAVKATAISYQHTEAEKSTTTQRLKTQGNNPTLTIW
jgi:hypothetical protein